MLTLPRGSVHSALACIFKLLHPYFVETEQQPGDAGRDWRWDSMIVSSFSLYRITSALNFFFSSPFNFSFGICLWVRGVWFSWYLFQLRSGHSIPSLAFKARLFFSDRRRVGFMYLNVDPGLLSFFMGIHRNTGWIDGRTLCRQSTSFFWSEPSSLLIGSLSIS